MSYFQYVSTRHTFVNRCWITKIARPFIMAFGIAVLSLMPNNSSALEPIDATESMNVASKLSEEGMHDEAIKIMNIVIKLDPMDSDAIFWRGLLNFKEKLNRSAIKDFNKSISISPDHYHSHLFRAYAYGSSKDYKNAMSDWKAVIRLDPTNSQNYNGEAYWMMYALHTVQGEIELERSCDLLKKAKELGYTKPFTNKTMQEFC